MTDDIEFDDIHETWLAYSTSAVAVRPGASEQRCSPSQRYGARPEGSDLP